MRTRHGSNGRGRPPRPATHRMMVRRDDNMSRPLPPPPVACRSAQAGAAVKKFPRGVEVPGVPGGFPDHVQDDPAQVHRLLRLRPAPGIPARIPAPGPRIEGRGRDDGIRPGDLLPVKAEHLPGRDARPGQPPGLLACRELDRLPGRDAAEPVPLVIDGQVADQPQAGPARRNTARRSAASGRPSTMSSTLPRC
jgi:hypothetical protein